MNKILIIIINNRNKMKMKFNTIIHTLKYEYKLLCCITESKEGQNFNIILNSKNIWYAIKNNENHKKEVGNDIGSLIKYPCVLFFEKGNKLNISNNKNLNIMSENKKIVLDKNPGIMTNNLYSPNILMTNNNHIKHNKHNLNANKNKQNVIMLNNNNQMIQTPYNLNNMNKVNTIIPQNNMINNPYEQIIINNNPKIKKNGTNIKTKNNNFIEKIEGNLGSINIGINNIVPETVENNKINDINDININYDNKKNFNYENIKNNQNMPNNQGNKNNIPINNIEKNNLNNGDVNTCLVMNAFN